MTDETREILDRLRGEFQDPITVSGSIIFHEGLVRCAISEIERLSAEVERLRGEPVGYVVVCRNRLGDVHYIASGPRHMHPWTLEYAQTEARRIHHNDDWLTCTVHPVGPAVEVSDG